MWREYIQDPRFQRIVGDVRKIHKVFQVFWQWGAGWLSNWAGGGALCVAQNSVKQLATRRVWQLPAPNAWQ